MNQFLELLISGLSLGCIYALIALGFVIVFKATHVVNFAHGSVLLLGAYLVARWHDGARLLRRASLGAAVACAVVAALIDVVLVRALRRRGGGVDTLAILTIGVDILLATELTRRIGTDILRPARRGARTSRTSSGVAVPQTRVAAAVVADRAHGRASAPPSSSPTGASRMRSAAADRETAALMGIRLSRVAAGAWAVAGALAAIARRVLHELPGAGREQRDVGLLALTAIPAAVLGGLDSTAGAVVGGLIIGVAIDVHRRLPGRARRSSAAGWARSRPTS